MVYTARPRKYRKRELSTAVDEYFHSISRTAACLDALGQAITNDAGAMIMRTEYVIPPSVSGLCLHLGIDRSTWQNYCDEKQYPEFGYITRAAKSRIEAYLEEQLLTREKGLQGIIFNLQNNYGWKQKSEVELGKETRRTVSAEGLSIKEKLALIASEQAMREAAIAGKDGEDGDDE